MKKIIRNVDESRGIVQVTTVDERWYAQPTLDPQSGLPVSYEYVPSVTWIAGHYPKGLEFYKWLASKGWDESQAIKQAAGDKGSKVHYAVADLIAGKKIEIGAKYPNHTLGELEELTLEEYECLMSFVDWYEKGDYEVLGTEYVVWNKEYNFAGTVDIGSVRRSYGN